MKNLKIGTRLGLGFAVTLMLMVLMTTAVTKSMDSSLATFFAKFAGK